MRFLVVCIGSIAIGVLVALWSPFDVAVKNYILSGALCALWTAVAYLFPEEV